MSIRVEGLDHVAVAVSDQQGSQDFYRDVLGLAREHEAAWGDMPMAMMAGGSGMALFPSRDGSTGFRHLAFRVDRENFERAQAQLRERGIAFTLSDHDVSHSIYFED